MLTASRVTFDLFYATDRTCKKSKLNSKLFISDIGLFHIFRHFWSEYNRRFCNICN